MSYLLDKLNNRPQTKSEYNSISRQVDEELAELGRLQDRANRANDNSLKDKFRSQKSQLNDAWMAYDDRLGSIGYQNLPD